MTLAYPRAIIFDLDDTILDYDTVAEAAWQAVCSRYASRVTGGDAPALLQAINAESDRFWDDPERHRRGRLNLPAARFEVITAVLHEYGISDPELAMEMARLRTAIFDENLQPFQGAIDAVSRLYHAGIRLGMITNGAEEVQNQKIERFGLRPYFDCILIEGAFGIGKPDPRVFNHVLVQLSSTPADTWMVGDSLPNDIAPAQALGIYTVWHDHRGVGLPAAAGLRPDRIIRSLNEL